MSEKYDMGASFSLGTPLGGCHEKRDPTLLIVGVPNFETNSDRLAGGAALKESKIANMSCCWLFVWAHSLIGREVVRKGQFLHVMCCGCVCQGSLAFLI